jgi:hypothetical protein
MDTSENGEAAIVAIGTALTTVGAYIATTALPDYIKTPVVVILEAIGIGLLAYWRARVNTPKPTTTT